MIHTYCGSCGESCEGDYYEPMPGTGKQYLSECCGGYVFQDRPLDFADIQAAAKENGDEGWLD